MINTFSLKVIDLPLTTYLFFCLFYQPPVFWSVGQPDCVCLTVCRLYVSLHVCLSGWLADVGSIDQLLMLASVSYLRVLEPD